MFKNDRQYCTTRYGSYSLTAPFFISTLPPDTEIETEADYLERLHHIYRASLRPSDNRPPLERFKAIEELLGYTLKLECQEALCRLWQTLSLAHKSETGKDKKISRQDILGIYVPLLLEVASQDTWLCLPTTPRGIANRTGLSASRIKKALRFG